ncbi:DUF4174 domain-containing protein [Lewinella sp. IMCC34183]|uniref:DUF4174 domain-containing protein n=1 Tax=Lewinella sp. IMCC34183 TaxID=2248762 RepID=UPI000E2607D3|nr:DUF4174 domain-containing protein [Lewinella sp. IMCC34183]
MKPLLPLLLLLALPVATAAQSLNEFRWKSRLVILFTPAVDDPLFLQQRALLGEANDALRERRVTILMVTPEGDHSNSTLFLGESASEYFYEQFSAQPYQFELSLVGLDGEEKYRAKNEVTPVSVLTEMIDAMPMRQRRLKQGLGNKSSINAKEPAPGVPDGRNNRR